MRRPVAIGAALAICLAASIYGYNVYRNLDAADRAKKACDASGTHVESILGATNEWLALLSSSPDHVEELMRSAIIRPCDVVQSELVWWRWGWGTELTIDLDPRGEMATAGRELAQRCPDVMGGVVRESFLREEADRIVDEVCGQLDSALLPAAGTEQTLPLWGWADELEAREEMLRPSN